MRISLTPGHRDHTPYRRMLAVAASASLALSIASCNVGAHGQEPALTSLSSQSVEDLKQGASAQELHDASLRTLPTKAGKLFISTSYSTGTATKKPDVDVTRIVSRDPSTDQFQWAVSIKPSAADRQIPNSISDSKHGYDRTASQSHAGDMIVSPDGRHLSLVLTPDESQKRGVPATDRHTHVIVLDTQTGKAVRTAKVSGVILGQALTNSALAVETAQNYFPAGSGKGTITTFSLTDTSAQPSSFPTDKWLVGAPRENLMLAPEPFSDNCSYGCSMMTVTLINADGSTAGSISGVTAVHPGGWIHRVADPKSDEQQLVNPSIKKTIDITGKSTYERDVPTGPGLLVEQKSPDGKGSTESKPAFWLSSSDDGHPHTENLEQFENH
mgnify:CR=1 FL=1